MQVGLPFGYFQFFPTNVLTHKSHKLPFISTRVLTILCIISSDPYLLEQSIELLKINIPSLDFAEVRQAPF